jgi:hypothetical protein
MAETAQREGVAGPAAPRVGLGAVLRCLDSCGLPHLELTAGAGRIVVSGYGGRILGPFLGEDSLGWLSPLFADAESFCAAVGGGTWNLGGDRIWLAPELSYNVRDRRHFLESYALQAAVDPGSYRLEPLSEGWTPAGASPAPVPPSRAGGCRLLQEIELERYDRPAPGRKRLRVERLVRPAGDPLRDVARYGELRDELSFSGYEQVVTLSDLRPDGRESQAWSITQVPPGGAILVPVVPGAEYQDHLEPAGEAHLELSGSRLRVLVRGDRLFKIELKAAHHFGRFGYYRPLPGGGAGLLVKLFFNNPSAAYVMEAPHRPGVRGYSLDIYHDDGGLGGFAEMECHGQPVGCPGGADWSEDRFLTWAYRGSEAAVREACMQLLGVSPD